MSLQFGIDIVLKNNPDWKQQRIGMLTNDAAKTNTGIHSRLALKNAGFNLVQLFSPEHGMNAIGVDGALMNDGIDEITKLPIKSLYGEKFMPSEEDLKDIDIMLFDIPDAGTRFYTYLWSMTYWIEAAAKYKKHVIILDRPNPLGGDLNSCEGPMLDTKLTSFIGRFNIPIKHQCTFGELAHYFNALQNWNAQLTVIKAEGWKRNQFFYDWNLPWWNPSPALQNMEATLLYPGLCFFEATNVSIGRGTKYSFEWLGAEWLNIPAVVMVCQHILKEDIVVETVSKGIRIKVIDPYSYDAVLNGLILLKLIKDLHPTHFKWAPYPTLANPSGGNHLSLLLGMPNAEIIFELPLQEWLQQIGKNIKVSGWSKNIAPYLLYP